MSLESGIGCFDYAAEMIGWQNVAHCEIEPFCLTILKYYWPNADSHADVFKLDGRPYRGRIGVLTCGFPCQPFSLAGKGKGDKDDRFIWPENMRIIREMRPTYVVAENVPGLLSKHPLVFERVCADLENEGYEVTPIIIPACAAQEDHIRERIFFVAHNHRYGHGDINGLGENRGKKGANQGYEDKWERHRHEPGRVDTKVADAAYDSSQRLARRFRGELAKPEDSNGAFQGRKHCGIFPKTESWPEAATRLCRVDDGYAGRLDTTTISKAKWRKESIRGYGNAVHWKVAFEIFKAIESTTP
jgi:DNA (cytosine-5)-methyltransferase 1